MLPVIIFGGILGGIFSPTEAAAVAVFYAAVVAFAYRELTSRMFYEILVETAMITGAVGLILGAASGFSTLLALEGVPDRVGAFITGLSSNPIFFLILVNLTFMIFGAILDGIPALLLFLPIFLPVSASLGIDPLHFTLLSVASLGVGLVLPPIGIMLLVVCSVTKTPLGAVSRAMLPYLGILALCLLLIIAVPEIVLVLPRAFGL
jgi:C4-dicarboxylate transporter DctM subunit